MIPIPILSFVWVDKTTTQKTTSEVSLPLHEKTIHIFAEILMFSISREDIFDRISFF